MEKVQKMRREIPRSLVNLARNLSKEDGRIWFVMYHPKFDPIVVVYADHGRFMGLGYKVECCFYQGKRHGNAYRDGDRFWFTED